MTHICVTELIRPVRHHSLTWINAEALLTHWGQETHICVSNLAIIGSDNGLSPGRHQAIIWSNAGILLIGPTGTNTGEFSIGTQTFSFTKMPLKMSSLEWRSLYLGLNVLIGPMLESKYDNNQRRTWIWKFRLLSGGHLLSGSMCQCTEHSFSFKKFLPMLEAVLLFSLGDGYVWMMGNQWPRPDTARTFCSAVEANIDVNRRY